MKKYLLTNVTYTGHVQNNNMWYTNSLKEVREVIQTTRTLSNFRLFKFSNNGCTEMTVFKKMVAVTK